MSTKPVVLDQQRNNGLKSAATAALLPALVDNNGNIVNASGFMGPSIHGGPILETAIVLSIPDADCKVSPDQIVSGELHTASTTAPRTVTFPDGDKIFKYLTAANCKSQFRGFAGTAVNIGTAPGPGLEVPEASVLIPAFKTRVFVAAADSISVTLGTLCSFRDGDLSNSPTTTTRVLAGQVGITTEYTLHWYVLNSGGLSFPNDLPRFVIVLTR